MESTGQRRPDRLAALVADLVAVEAQVLNAAPEQRLVALGVQRIRGARGFPAPRVRAARDFPGNIAPFPRNKINAK